MLKKTSQTKHSNKEMETPIISKDQTALGLNDQQIGRYVTTIGRAKEEMNNMAKTINNNAKTAMIIEWIPVLRQSPCQE